MYADEESAELYDLALGWPRRAEADFVQACLAQYGASRADAPRTLLDVACGAGHFLAEMHSRGWQVAGVDASPAMLARARRRLPEEVPLEAAGMSEFALAGPFAAATCWSSSLTYLLSNEAIVDHLRRVARVLVPGGLYLVDIGFASWCHPMWSGLENWRPDFSGGWSVTVGTRELYHDGDEGPPCDGWAHVCTEYLHFRWREVESGTISERTYTSPKRALHPQEFAALVAAAGDFRCAGWFSGAVDMGQPFEGTDGRGRAVVVLRREET